MTEFLLWLMLATPLVLALLQSVRPDDPRVNRYSAWAALPALVLLAFGNTFTVDAPWLLLGARLGVDAVGRVFFGLTAALWLAAGIFARSYLADDANRGRFPCFFLLTMAGNLGVTVALDLASFLTFFTLMSVAAYGLITHDRQAASLRAGRVYMVMTIAGEMFLFTAMLLLAQEAGSHYFVEYPAALAQSPRQGVIVGLLCTGFGIKLGIMPLHVWLPLAHPAAPTPASAVLSGAIIKTGLLGLLRTLPLGMVAVHNWGNVCLLAGIISSVLAALIGITQRNPKTVLAYSSVSQMGLIAVGLGVALTTPSAAPAVLPALLLLVVHHATAKAALFLGVGVSAAQLGSTGMRVLVQGGLLMAALALAGLPLTMGFSAKAALKDSAAAMAWGAEFAWMLHLTSLTTALLVARFLWLVWPHRQSGHGRLTAGMAVPWAVLSAAGVLGFLILSWQGQAHAGWTSLRPASLWGSVWPLLAAGAIVVVVIFRPRLPKMQAWLPIPEGDIVVPLIAAARWGRQQGKQITLIRLPQWFQAARRQLIEKPSPAMLRLLSRLTHSLENEVTAGLLIALLVVALLAVSLW